MVTRLGRAAGSIALCGSGLLLACQLLLSLGAWRVTETFDAPFQPFGSHANAFVVPVGADLPLKEFLTAGGDRAGAPQQSTLKLSVGDRALGPSRAPHERIATRGGGAYSHWGDYLVFSLPDSVHDALHVSIRVEYSVRLKPMVVNLAWTTALAAATMLVWALRRQDPAIFERRLSLLVVAGARLLWALLAVLGAAAGLYLLSIAFGIARGVATPSTWIFFAVPWTEKLAVHEPAFPQVILSLALAGASLSWLSLLAPDARTRFRIEEYRLLRVWRATAPAIVLAMFFFSVSGPWHGIYRLGDIAESGISGLVPFNDAARYFADPYGQAMNGTWGSFALRRPIAAATKTLVSFFSGYSAIASLILQILALAAATYAATRAVTRWRGLWAGLTFFGLVLALVRPFLPVHLTEPWGLIWALVAVPFLIHGLRPGTGLARPFAIGATCLSLLTRMGSMLTLPAMVAWALWADRRDGVRRMVSLATVGLALALPVAINASLARLYGSDEAMTGANFAHVLCGLTHGGNFATCGSLYANEFANLVTDTEVANAHLRKAITRFMTDPRTFVDRLAEGERYFVANFQVAMLYGYRFQDSAPFFPRFLWYFVGAIGLLWVVLRGTEEYERSFWVVISLGLLASVPWVMFDEGWRVLSGSFVLIALLAASGFSTPAAVVARAGQREVVRMCRRGAIAAGVLVCLYFVIPALAYRVDALDAHYVKQQIAGPNEAIILGGRHLPAFLVVPDDRSVPTSFPAMRFSDFQKVIKASDIEQYQKLLVPALAGRAFGFAMSPGPSRPGAIFITPPEVVSNRDASAWKLRLSESDVLRGPRFFLVEDAELLRMQDR